MNIEGYEVNKGSVGSILPILPLASTDTAAFQIKLVAACVTKDGVKLSEQDVNDIPFIFYMKKLMPAVMELNGMVDSGNE